MLDLPMWHGKLSEPCSESQLTCRSPDGQALMLSSSDGYCSIVVFDLAELGTVHPTQQHHRQLAAIAQSHSHSHHISSAASTPMPHSPAVSTMRASPAPGRSEREGSTSSSIAPPQSTSLPPLFMPSFVPPPSSVSSNADPVPFTPGEESEKDYSSIKIRTGRSESESSASVIAGLGIAIADDARKNTASGDGEKRGKEGDEKADGEAPKKKRRVALTHLGDTD